MKDMSTSLSMRCIGFTGAGGKGEETCKGDLIFSFGYLDKWQCISLKQGIFITQKGGLEEKYELHFVMTSINFSLGGMTNRLPNI